MGLEWTPLLWALGRLPKGVHWAERRIAAWQSRREHTGKLRWPTSGRRLLLIGREPPRWGQWTPNTLDIMSVTSSFTDVRGRVKIPLPDDREQRNMLARSGLAVLPPDVRRGAALEVMGQNPYRLSVWLYSDGRWVVECTRRGFERIVCHGEPGRFPGGAWHDVWLRRTRDGCQVFVDGSPVAEGLPQWPLQSRLRLRVTSPHMQAIAEFGKPMVWEATDTEPGGAEG